MRSSLAIEMMLAAVGVGLIPITGAAAWAQLPPTLVRRNVSVRKLLSLRDIGGYAGSMSIAPNGRLVAFQLRQSDFAANLDRISWYVSSTLPHSKPWRIAAGGEVMLAPAPYGHIDGAIDEVRARWSPDGKWIAYLRRDGREIQVWRARVDGSREEQVTHNAANVTRFEWRPDGRAIYFEVGRDRAARDRADREEGHRGYLLDDRFFPEYSTRPSWFPCAGELWGSPTPASERCRPHTWIVEFGHRERLASVEETKAFHALGKDERPPGVGRGRATVRIAWNGNRSSAAWLENVSPKEFAGVAAPLTLFVDGRRCPAPQCTGRLGGVWWHGTEVVFLRSEGWAHGVPALYIWQPNQAAVKRIYSVDGTLRSCGTSGTRLLCLLEQPRRPRRIVSIRLDDGHVDTVFDPNPDFQKYALGRVEKIQVGDGLGNQGFGHLVYPPDYDPLHRYPLVIVQYRSRGFLRGGTGNEYPIYPLAAAGFLVYSADLPEDERIAEHYGGGDWKALIAYAGVEFGKTAYRWRRGLGAIDAALDRLECRGILDPARVGITGLSAGAGVLYYALVHSQRFAAAATSGMTSPESARFIVNETTRRMVRAQWDASSLAEAIRKGKRLSSFSLNLDRVRTPLLLQVPDRELVFDLPDYVALKEAGRPVEAYVFPDEYHVKYQPLHKLAVGERVIDWFRFWLKGEEDPDPKKAAQYERWRVLRQEADRLGETSRNASPPRQRCNDSAPRPL